MKKYAHTSEVLLISLLIVIAISLNIFMLVRAFSITPSGREFIPVYSSLDQYAFAVSVIKQGNEGGISVFNRYPFFFLLLGWCAALFRLTNAHLTYHAARLLLLIFWYIALYRLINVLSSRKWLRITVIGFSTLISLLSIFTPDMLFGQIMLMTVCLSVIKYLRHDTGLVSRSPVKQTKRENHGFSTWWHYDSKSGKRWLVRGIVAGILMMIVYPRNLPLAHTAYQYREAGFSKAIYELETIISQDQIILSGSDSGMLIPTYINRTVFIGSEAFYSGGMNACDAYTYAKTNKIGAVFFSETEKVLGNAVRFYSFSQPWNAFVYRFVDVKPVGCKQ